MTIISPADCVEILKTLESCVNSPHPVYIRLTGTNLPVACEDDYEFQIGRAVWLRGGEINYHFFWHNGWAFCQSGERTYEKGIEIGLVNMHISNR